MVEHELWCWADGQLRRLAAPVLAADDSAFAHGLGCFTTARISAGSVRYGARHAQRLVRDARALGIGEIDRSVALRALVETGRAAFGSLRDGIVRVQASRGAAGEVHLTAITRPIGHEPTSWRASTAPFAHEGPMPWRGAKVSNQLLFALASRHAAQRGAEEAVLLDRTGYVIEGARSNLVIVGPDGRPALPSLERGGVAGIARAVLCERVPELAIRHVSGLELERAQELIAINAVRGARAIVSLDGRDIGRGRPGPWAAVPLAHTSRTSDCSSSRRSSS